MVFVLSLAGHLLLGWGVASRVWNEGHPNAPAVLERICAALTIAVGVLLGVDWLLALTHTFTREVLFARGAVVLIAGIVLCGKEWRSLARPVAVGPATVAVLAAITCWVVFIAWRGTITPPLSHDVLSNHLPRAVLYWRSRGFIDLTLVSKAFRDLPANYELLLADMLVLLRHDRHTEWVSTFFYLTFVLCGATLAWRWWRSGTVAAVVSILVAGTPIALLHSGADKNDLLVGTFMTAALVWAGRWWALGDFPSLLLLATSLFIGLGTKPQVAFLGAALLPLVLWRMYTGWRGGSLRPRAIAAAVAFGLVASFLLGGYTYVDQRFRESPPQAASKRAWPAVQVRTMAYGDWDNLWQAPYTLVMAPFAPSPYKLYVPWESQPWFWKRYEIYFSHFGVPFALCLVAAPFSIAAWRAGDARNERVVIAAATLAALILQLPAVLRPHGAYLISLPRYAMYIAAPVFAWTIGALVVTLHRRRPRLVKLLPVVGLFSFVATAVDVTIHDAFAPLDYVLLARQFPGTRFIPFDSNRATSQLDLLAGPNDVVAADVNWASWVHPLFGARLSRPVYFIPPGDGPVQLPSSVDWVVVERAYDVIWGNAEMKTLGDARQKFLRNPPKPADLRVFRALVRDPRFRLVHLEEKRNQAVFKRIRDAAPERRPVP